MSGQNNNQHLPDSAPSLPSTLAFVRPADEDEPTISEHTREQPEISDVNGYLDGEMDTASQASTTPQVNGQPSAETNMGPRATPTQEDDYNNEELNTPRQVPLGHPQANVYVHEDPDIGAFQARQGQRIYGQQGPGAQVPPGTPQMDGYRYERLNAGAPYIPHNAPGMNRNGQGQGLPTISEVSSEEPAARLHRVLIEFQPPPVQVPVVLPEFRASYAGVQHRGALGSSIPLTGQSLPPGHPRMSDSPRTINQPRSPESPRASEYSQMHETSQTPSSDTQYIPICPSPSPSSSTAPSSAPVNSTDPPEPTQSPPPTLDNLSEAFWHEYDTILTPEAIAYQASLLSAWNTEASTTRNRTAEERAHVRAVRLESELLSERERRERRDRRREARRDRHPQEQRRSRREDDDERGSVDRGPQSLLSGILLRLRERVMNRMEPSQAQSTLSRLTNIQLSSRSSTNLSLPANTRGHSHTRSHPRPRTRSRSRSRPSPTPPPPEPTSQSPLSSSSSSSSSSLTASPTPSPSPSPPSQSQSHQNETETEPETEPTPLCTLCTTNPGTLIQGPLSESLPITSSAGELPFVCCQKCLDEVLEAEVEVANRRDRDKERDGEKKEDVN